MSMKLRRTIGVFAYQHEEPENDIDRANWRFVSEEFIDEDVIRHLAPGWEKSGRLILGWNLQNGIWLLSFTPPSKLKLPKWFSKENFFVEKERNKKDWYWIEGCYQAVDDAIVRVSTKLADGSLLKE